MEFFISCFITFTMATLFVGIVGGVYSHGRKRVFLGGFAIGAWGFLMISYGWERLTYLGDALLTTQALDYFDRVISGAPSSSGTNVSSSPNVGASPDIGLIEIGNCAFSLASGLLCAFGALRFARGAFREERADDSRTKTLSDSTIPTNIDDELVRKGGRADASFGGGQVKIVLPRGRFRVRTLFIAMTVAAALLTLLRFSETPTVAGWILFATCSLAIAILGAIWGTGPAAHACAGFALCAGPYLLLFSPYDDFVSRNLPVWTFLDTVEESLIAWLTPPNTQISGVGIPPPPVGAAGPLPLFPLAAYPYSPFAACVVELGIKPPSMGEDDSILGTGIGPLPKADDACTLGLAIEPPYTALDASPLGIGICPPADDPTALGYGSLGYGGPANLGPVIGCCFSNETSPLTTAIGHCISTLLVGICGAAAVCWLRKPRDRS